MTSAVFLAAVVGATTVPPTAEREATSAGVAPVTSAGVAPVTASAVPNDDRIVAGVFRNEAGERRYKLFIPDGAGPPGGRPLVVMLHGCTQDADDIARGSRMNGAAKARGWMVLYPEQPATHHIKKCWHWYDPRHQHRGAGEPSLVAGMTRQISLQYGADTSRVFLAGVSAGAAMASLVAAAYPEVYSALALHSGLVHSASATVIDALGVMQKGVPSPEPHAVAAFAEMGARARVVPTLVIHGERDAVLAPINGAQAAKQWFLTNALVMGQPLDTTSGATNATLGEEGGYHLRTSTYRANDGTPLSTLVMVKELGHAWSGGSSAGTFADERGPDATRRVFEFFAAVPRR